MINEVEQKSNHLDLCRIFSRTLKTDSEIKTDSWYQGNYYHSVDSSWIEKKWRASVTRIETKQQFHKQVKKNTKRDRVHVSVHKNMIKIKVEQALQALPTIGGLRGKIAGFSSQSRKNMIELVNKQRNGTPKLFVSLTYPDEEIWFENGRRKTTHLDWKKHLEILRKRIERAYPSMLGLWRIELKNRLSGANLGKIAPHFHLLVWNEDNTTKNNDNLTFEQWIQKTWYEIVGSEEQKHFDNGTFVSKIKSARHALFYVSKYVAKIEDSFFDDFAIGRRWGRIGNFDTNESVEFSMSQKEYAIFRRLIRSWLKSKGIEYYKRICNQSLDFGLVVFGMSDTGYASNWSEMPLAIRMFEHVFQQLE